MADSGPRTTSVRGIVYARGDLYREALEALRGLLRGDEPCVLARWPDEPYACSRGTKGCNKQHPPDVRETAFGVLSRAEGGPE